MNTSTFQWQRSLLKLAERALGRERGRALCRKYQALLTEGYQSMIAPRFALKDMLHLERMGTSRCPVAGLLCSGSRCEYDRLHFYSREERYLDEYIPLLENLNFRVMDQVQFTVPVGDATFYIKSFTIKAAQQPCDTVLKLRRRLLDAIQAILVGRVENDAMNKLIILAGLEWQAVDVLRAYRNYYLQLANRTTRGSIHQALIRNPVVALCLYDFFDARFKPYADGEDSLLREESVLMPMYFKLLQNMEKVEELNDDRILRNLFNLIDSTMRCNFHVRRSAENYFIAFKIASLGIIEMAPPKPQYEIYVHASTMQGIHLRAGKVSRGGIRWSDRPDDFRSEILGLMQTQISKNALIVPTGAKGGFVLTGKTAAEDIKTAGKTAYTTLIKGLLDLTDNYDDRREVVHPPKLVVYDDPDPYLVVAADKGTAQFSDIANQISKDYRFWLDDAFASGGSHGYNHKSLGITARGAWECVKRHFRELNKDIQNEAFDVVGIGSMDGDVFGNGMLLSPCIRLRAAFSGQHIFIDPDPSDLNAAFNERKRLFDMSGSSWNDYNRALLSKGGGVYLRAAKDIPLSPELKKWLGIHYRSLDGESLIRYLLTAQTDLLWLGGIGTYIKASFEKNEEVGDRANDNVRVNASALRAKVVGEGANLGFTQKARIEYSLLGGRINTDAVDNSAGVDTSDREVNLKILLALLDKMNLPIGHKGMFEQMTQEVCRLVLADNYAQSQCLSLEQLRCAEKSGLFFQVADRLEAAGFFEGVKEVFPSAKDVNNRSGKVIARPEFAVLMAASKMFLTDLLQGQTGLLGDSAYDRYLQVYFPVQIGQTFKDKLSLHPLADKIKATVISNKLINQAGCRFLSPQLGGEKIDLMARIKYYLAFEQILDADRLRRDVENLDNRAPAALQYRLLQAIEATLNNFCVWALFRQPSLGFDSDMISAYKRYLHDYTRDFEEKVRPVDDEVQADIAQLEHQGIPHSLAAKITLLSRLDDFLRLAALSTETKQDIATVARRYDDVTVYLRLDGVYKSLSALPCQDEWQRIVTDDLMNKLKTLAGEVSVEMLARSSGSCAEFLEALQEKSAIDRYFHFARQLTNGLPSNLYPYLVVAGQLEKVTACFDSNRLFLRPVL